MGKKKYCQIVSELVPLGDTHRVNELMWQVLSGSRVCAHAPCQGCRVPPIHRGSQSLSVKFPL